MMLTAGFGYISGPISTSLGFTENAAGIPSCQLEIFQFNCTLFPSNLEESVLTSSNKLQ